MARTQLYLAHRVVICSAIALGALFTVYSGARYRTSGQSASLALCALSGAATVALAVYFRWFLKKAQASPKA